MKSLLLVKKSLSSRVSFGNQTKQFKGISTLCRKDYNNWHECRSLQDSGEGDEGEISLATPLVTLKVKTKHGSE